VNTREAARLQGRLSARYPHASVAVTADMCGARIVLSYQGGGYLHVTTGDQSGVVLRAMLGRDLRAVKTPQKVRRDGC
jgi:hypothetical protein